MSTICAIIPTYNRASLLREALDAILKQTRPIDQIIVVNDGSTDDTESVVQSYGMRVTLITKPNGGKAAALNTGLAQCTADYVWICDDDDMAAPDGIEALANLLDNDPSLGLAMGRYIGFRMENGKPVYNDPGFLGRAEEPNFKILLLEHMIIGLSAMLVRRPLYEKIGPYRQDIGMTDDYDMALRLVRDVKTAYVDKVIYFYRQHEGPRGNITHSLSDLQKLFGRIHKEYRLEEFTPTFALGWEPTRQRRAALIERACVFARRSLWNEAFEDIRRAADLLAGPVTPEELHLAENVVYRRGLWENFAQNPLWIGVMKEGLKTGGFTRSILQAMLRPLVWRARDAARRGDIAGVVKFLRLLLRIAGTREGMARIASSLAG